MDTEKELEIMLALSRERYPSFQSIHEVIGLIEGKKACLIEMTRGRRQQGEVEIVRSLIQIQAIAKLALKELYPHITDEEYQTQFPPAL